MQEVTGDPSLCHLLSSPSAAKGRVEFFMNKSVAVLGLGKFGKGLAENLYRLGADVLVVDKNEELVDEFADKCTSPICANLEDEDEVASLGLKNMDVVVTAMGGNLAASIMSVAVAKDQGVPLVISKTSSRRMSSILRKVGADRILDPEGEGGERVARVMLSSNFQDLFKVDNNLYLIEMKPKKDWVGKSPKELALRKAKNLNVVAVKEAGKSWHMVDANKPFAEDNLVLISMEKKDLSSMQVG